jgi:hypothetical protein
MAEKQKQKTEKVRRNNSKRGRKATSACLRGRESYLSGKKESYLSKRKQGCLFERKEICLSERKES